jgi:hemerythrin-like domain-containing protein
MRPTELLKEEHAAIKEMLRVLEAACAKLESGEAVNPEHLEQMVEFIRGFADRCHHMKEEDLLFPAMEAAGIPKEGGPIGVMLMEHTMGRDYVRGMSEAIARYKAGEPSAGAAFAQNARDYIGLLAQHIDKEDNVLYVIADAHLAEESQEKLMEGFEKVETEEMGAGTHEKFHALLHHLKDVYLT